MRHELYREQLNRLAALLRSAKRPMTARQIADKLCVTRATVANRLEVIARLRVANVKRLDPPVESEFATESEYRDAVTKWRTLYSDGRRGPLSIAFKVGL